LQGSGQGRGFVWRKIQDWAEGCSDEGIALGCLSGNPKPPTTCLPHPGGFVSGKYLQSSAYWHFLIEAVQGRIVSWIALFEAGPGSNQVTILLRRFREAFRQADSERYTRWLLSGEKAILPPPMALNGISQRGPRKDSS